jgi:hypothetical protein
MNDRSVTLDALGLKFGTDKSSSHHNYLTFYERFFEKYQDRQVRILEVGVLEGASLKVWEEYFPNGTIVGADINPWTARFARSRVKIEIIDQSNVEDLVRLGMTHGLFDIIIEDGSHFWEHQITTLRTLFPFLRNGGIYIVEDLQTNFGPMIPHFQGVSITSCVEYLKKLVDLRVADDQIDISKEEDAFLRTYGRAIQFMAFYRRACLIEKAHPQNVPRSNVGQPLVPIRQDLAPVPISILCHIGNEGDAINDSGWINRVDQGVKGNNIQGFAIICRADTNIDILYKAKLADGTWTDWTESGKFVGTRGKIDDLTGFSVRVGDACRDDYNIEVIGAFRGEANNAVVSGGEDCVPISGRAPLCGMQVIVRAKSVILRAKSTSGSA